MGEPETRLIANGTTGNGASWTLSASRERSEYRGRTEDGLLVMMHLTAADGLRHGKAGLGDLPPVPGRMMRINWSSV